MKVYLVGGAVRDKLLGYPVKERDWVVVGGTAQALLSQGYQRVGRDFPVFLHPITKEQYALARTERKLTPGYYGFDCNYDSEVSLEQDLLRRDLTINAMAMDDKQQIIDPHGGQEDLKGRILRHVSPAFKEDPVRVLRVARFAARYHHLGFKLSAETRLLIYKMIDSQELTALIAERVWQEWQLSLSERNPEVFIQLLRDCGVLKVILPELDALFGVPNQSNYHPEIDSGVHSLMVLQAACHLSDSPIIRFAALVHDLGKAQTAVASWPKHPNHAKEGVLIIQNLCQRLKVANDYAKLAQLVSQVHILIHCLQELKAHEILNVFEQTDAFRRPKRFAEILTVCKADALGCAQAVLYQNDKHWQYLLNKLLEMNIKKIVSDIEKADIKKTVYQKRLATLQSLLDSRIIL